MPPEKFWSPCNPKKFGHPTPTYVAIPPPKIFCNAASQNLMAIPSPKRICYHHKKIVTTPLPKLFLVTQLPNICTHCQNILPCYLSKIYDYPITKKVSFTTKKFVSTPLSNYFLPLSTPAPSSTITVCLWFSSNIYAWPSYT